MNRFPTRLSALLFVSLLLFGCGRTPAVSGYGVAWVVVTAEPSDYSSYMVTLDSITLTRSDGIEVTAIGTPEVVDFAQLSRNHEMWGTGAIPIGVYVAATVTLDYSTNLISLPVAGHPVQAGVFTPEKSSGVQTVAVTIRFDPANPLIIQPTYASTDAEVISIDFDLPASGYYATEAPNKAIAVVRPFITAGRMPSDTKLIRIRGPLINSAANVQTYSVYVRPFYDEANNIGAISLFAQPSTIWTLNGKSYVGSAGLAALSQLSAGITMTAAYTQFEFTTNPHTPELTYAGKFDIVYAICASSLEDQYTEGLSGTIVSRNGDTLALQGSTLILNTADTFSYEIADTLLVIGPGTTVTADDTTLSGLDSSSIHVGQHITARGIYSLTSSNVVVLDATGTSATNTGSVRLQPTEVFGTLTSGASGSLLMNASTIDGWPSSVFAFSGVDPASFRVDTGNATVASDLTNGGPVFVNGLLGPVPPDFLASAVNSQNSVQLAGIQKGAAPAILPGPGGPQCGSGSQICDQAMLRVQWNTNPGTAAPFLEPTTDGFFIDLTNAYLQSAKIVIGPESIDLKSLPADLRVKPTPSPVTETFSPRYAVGNPATASATTVTIPTSTTSTVTSALNVYSSFAAFMTEAERELAAAQPAEQLVARGYYDPTSNAFYATAVDFAL